MKLTQSLKRASFTTRAAATATLMLAMAPATSSAVDFGGYFRVGPGSTSKNASRACYGLSGPGLKYRLGNECDIYGEFTFTQAYKKDGLDYKVVLMPNIWNGGTDDAGAKFGLAQMYAEGKGFDLAPDATFWIGKRRGRADVHIVDTNFVEMDGVGGGIEGIAAGPGKLGFAYYRDDGTSNKAGNRFNVDYHSIPVNEGGKLRLVGTAVNGTFAGGTNGYGLTVQHNQDNFLGLGGGNVVWLQTSSGSANLNANFGSLSAQSSDRSVRLIESFTWQKGPFGGQALAFIQKDKAAGLTTTSATIGGRASYAFTKNFKLVTELGVSTKKPENGDKQRVTKFTIAPTLATGPDFWNRPELRLYATHAKWNAAANAAAGPNGLTGVPANAGKTSGTSYGLQVEWWF